MLHEDMRRDSTTPLGSSPVAGAVLGDYAPAPSSTTVIVNAPIHSQQGQGTAFNNNRTYSPISSYELPEHTSHDSGQLLAYDTIPPNKISTVTVYGPIRGSSASPDGEDHSHLLVPAQFGHQGETFTPYSSADVDYTSTKVETIPGPRFDTPKQYPTHNEESVSSLSPIDIPASITENIERQERHDALSSPATRDYTADIPLPVQPTSAVNPSIRSDRLPSQPQHLPPTPPLKATDIYSSFSAGDIQPFAEGGDLAGGDAVPNSGGWGLDSPAGKRAQLERRRAEEAEIRALELLGDLVTGSQQQPSQPTATTKTRTPIHQPSELPIGDLPAVRATQPSQPPPPVVTQPHPVSPPLSSSSVTLSGLSNPRHVRRVSPPRPLVGHLEMPLPVDTFWCNNLHPSNVNQMFQSLKADIGAAMGVAEDVVDISGIVESRDSRPGGNNAAAAFKFGMEHEQFSYRYVELSSEARIPIPETMRVIRDLGGLSRSRRGSGPTGSRSSSMAEVPDIAKLQLLEAEQRAANLLSTLQHNASALQQDLQTQLDDRVQDINTELNQVGTKLRDLQVRETERSKRQNYARHNMNEDLSKVRQTVADRSASANYDPNQLSDLDQKAVQLKEMLHTLQSRAAESDHQNERMSSEMDKQLRAIKTEMLTIHPTDNVCNIYTIVLL